MQLGRIIGIDIVTEVGDIEFVVAAGGFFADDFAQGVEFAVEYDVVLAVDDGGADLGEDIFGAIIRGFFGQLHIEICKIVEFLVFAVFFVGVSIDGFEDALAVSAGIVQKCDDGAVFDMPVWETEGAETIWVSLARVAGS